MPHREALRRTCACCDQTSGVKVVPFLRDRLYLCVNCRDAFERGIVQGRFMAGVVSLDKLEPQ